MLAQPLARTRKLLDDGGDEQRMICTIPGFGYHRVADTRLVDSSAPERAPAPAAVTGAPLPADPITTSAAPARPRRPPVHMLAAAIGVVAIVAAMPP